MKFLLIAFLFLIPWSNFAQQIDHPHSILHSFIENKGQWNENVLFQSKFNGGNLWVQQNKFVFHLQDLSAMQEAHGNFNYKGDSTIHQTVLHLNFLGSNKVSKIEKLNPTEQYYNYFLGNVKGKWASDVHGFSEAILKDFYSGIDLKLIEEKEQLKYEFHVSPNISTEQIKLQFVGQNKIEVDKKGNLKVTTSLGQIIEEKPYSYQIKNGRILEIPCAFKVKGNVVTFELGEYDSNVELVIDPVLIFATYSGSATDNFGMTATYAYDAKAYSGGTIFGNAYPTPDNLAYDVTSNFTLQDNGVYGITDVFISKYSADGSTMLWTTFLGGGNTVQGTETVNSLICDKQNNVYLYGATSSTDFPIVNGFQTNHAGGVANSNYYQNGVYYTNQGTDIYVAKISSNGHNLLASTYVGGSANDGINYKTTSGNYSIASNYDSLTKNYGDQFRGEIMLDTVGNCLIASSTRSLNFPTVNPFQPTLAGGQDGVVFKLSSDLSTMIWSSYYGGSNNDACYSIKVDSSANIVFSGGTSSLNLPGMSGLNTSYLGGSADGFVAKLTSNGLSLTNATYVGTPDYDQAFFVEIDRNDNVFLLGQTNGGTFPVVNSGFVNPLSSQFIMKLDPTLSTILNSTVFGNGSTTNNISPSAFLIDICGNIYVSGWGANLLLNDPLSGMPITTDAFQATAPNGFDFYLFVLKRDFSNLLYATYLGGSQAREHVDGGTSRFDKNGVVYQSVCGGCGGHSDFPTTSGAHSNTNLSSNCNNILFKFDFELIPRAEFSVEDNIGCADFVVSFDNFSTDSDSYLWDFGNGDTTSVIFEPTITYTTPGTYPVYLYVTDSICLLTDTAELIITVTEALQISTSADISLCIPTQVSLTAFTMGSATNFIWSESINFTNQLNTNSADSILTITPTESTTYYVQASNPGCSIIDSVTVDFIGSSLSVVGNDSLCLGDQTTLSASSNNPNVIFTYNWTPTSFISGPSNQASINAVPNSTTWYYVVATAGNGCVANDSILVYVGDIPNGTVTATASSYNVPVGSTVTLSAMPNGYLYSWFDPNNVSQPLSQVTSAVLNEPTLFLLSVTDGICTKSDTVGITTYAFTCENPYVFVPNAFSPNGDNENDILYVRGAVIAKMIFRIYDRWGELVFESRDPHFGWDGQFRGKQMDPDVYDYYLEVDCIGGLNSIIKGNITLLK